MVPMGGTTTGDWECHSIHRSGSSRRQPCRSTGEVDHVTAHTLPGPNPSTGVLVSLGFQHVAG